MLRPRSVLGNLQSHLSSTPSPCLLGVLHLKSKKATTRALCFVPASLPLSCLNVKNMLVTTTTVPSAAATVMAALSLGPFGMPSATTSIEGFDVGSSSRRLFGLLLPSPSMALCGKWQHHHSQFLPSTSASSQKNG